MRLAIEVTTCTSSRTGVGYFTEHLVDALLETKAHGDDLLLLSNRPPARNLVDRWSSHLRIAGPAPRAVWMQTTVPRMLGEAHIDVAVFPNYTVPLASPCATVVVVHDLAILRTPQNFTLQKRLLMRAMLSRSIAAASVIATVSEASRRDIVDLLGVGLDRIQLLPCAAHPSCKPSGPDAVAEVRKRYGMERPYVLTVGTLEPRKDLLTVLRAFDRLRSHEHDLVVVGGRGWRDRWLVRALEERSRRQRVKWLGYVPESDLVALYTGADVFVFASTLEGFGLPVLEAMACGAPVVASDVPALREVGGDVPGFVSPGDDAAFADAIQHAIRARDGASNAHRASDGFTARAKGIARASQFSWTRTAEALWSRARVIGPARVQSAPSYGQAASQGAVSLPPPLHPPPAKIDDKEWALLAAVVYADLFNSPLPVRAALNASPGVTFSDESEIALLARSPRLSKFVVLHRAGFLVLTGRQHLVDEMPEREQLTRTLLERNRRGLSAIAQLPFVRALVISGGIAHKNPGHRPDVDLFVVAARGRAYTAYTMLFLATKLTGSRHLICPNYLVDESELAIAYHHDLFTAHQLVSSRPFSGQATYESFCRANEAWVKRFFPAFAPGEAVGSGGTGELQRVCELALRAAGPFVEPLLRGAWRTRLRRRAAMATRGDVVLSDGILKLHLSDYRRVVLQRFAARLEPLRVELGAESSVPQSALHTVGK